MTKQDTSEWKEINIEKLFTGADIDIWQHLWETDMNIQFDSFCMHVRKNLYSFWRLL